MIKSILLLAAALLCLLPSASPAADTEQTGRCHCFRDRDYDPANRFAADDYLLTTTFNSLVSATLGISKRQIVMMKMQGGVDSTELLIGQYIADKTGTPLDELLNRREKGADWQKIVSSLKKNPAPDDPVVSAIQAGKPDKQIEELISDDLISRRFHVPVTEIDKLRKQKFSDKEITVILALHEQTPLPVNKLIELSRTGNKSWSEIAAAFNLSPAAVGKFILSNPS